jgi:hypothetical protein
LWCIEAANFTVCDIFGVLSEGEWVLLHDQVKDFEIEEIGG